MHNVNTKEDTTTWPHMATGCCAEKPTSGKPNNGVNRKPGGITEKEHYKIHWGFNIQRDCNVVATCPDIVIILELNKIQR